jgi:hypothetical protein
MNVCMHMHACVCMYACMCVCMYVCMHVCMYVCVCVRRHDQVNDAHLFKLDYERSVYFVSILFLWKRSARHRYMYLEICTRSDVWSCLTGRIARYRTRKICCRSIMAKANPTCVYRWSECWHDSVIFWLHVACIVCNFKRLCSCMHACMPAFLTWIYQHFGDQWQTHAHSFNMHLKYMHHMVAIEVMQ